MKIDAATLQTTTPKPEAGGSKGLGPSDSNFEEQLAGLLAVPSIGSPPTPSALLGWSPTFAGPTAAIEGSEHPLPSVDAPSGPAGTQASLLADLAPGDAGDVIEGALLDAPPNTAPQLATEATIGAPPPQIATISGTATGVSTAGMAPPTEAGPPGPTTPDAPHVPRGLADAIDHLRPIPPGGATLDLEFPDLGRVQLRLDPGGDALRISILADSPEAAATIGARRNDLLAELAKTHPGSALELDIHSSPDRGHRNRGWDPEPEGPRGTPRSGVSTAASPSEPPRPSIAGASLVDIIA